MKCSNIEYDSIIQDEYLWNSNCFSRLVSTYCYRYWPNLPLTSLMIWLLRHSKISPRCCQLCIDLSVLSLSINLLLRFIFFKNYFFEDALDCGSILQYPQQLHINLIYCRFDFTPQFSQVRLISNRAITAVQCYFCEDNIGHILCEKRLTL